MPNGKHLAILRRGVKAWHAWDSEQLPRAAGQAVVEGALKAAGVQVETERGLGYRLVVGGDP